MRSASLRTLRTVSPSVLRASVVALLLVVCGCGPVWHPEYESAEAEARLNEKPLLLLYKNSLDLASARLEDVLEQPAARAHLRGKVLSVLVDDYPPNRKYMAQYSVFQPPALVLVHPDGTCHAYTGPAQMKQVLAFFEQAVPPGKQPELDPQIPRSIDYRWQGVYEDAVELAARQNRELFIFYKWWLSPECTNMLGIFQSRPEVARHFTETVNCILDMDYQPNRDHAAKYGVKDVPAMILVHRDGTYHAHSGFMTAPQIIRWVTSAHAPGRRVRSDSGGRTRARASYHWYSDFNRAMAHARFRDANLFVFYNSLYSDLSTRMARLLDQQQVAEMFRDTVNCRLDASVPANRELMKRYRVDRAPAFLVIRPDGAYQSRVGAANASDLAELLRTATQATQRPLPVVGAP